MARISIRRANEWDAPAMLKLYSPYVLGAPVTTPEEEVPTLAEYIQRIDRYTYGLGWVTCDIDSVSVGFCRLYENPDCPQNLFSMLKLYSPYVLGAPVTTPEVEVPALADYIQRIDRYTYGLGWVTCDIDSVSVGFCRLYENPDCPQNLFSLCVELYVAPFSLRVGVGSALLDLMMRIMSHGNRREIWARVPLPNPAAVAFFEKQGFCTVRIQTEAFKKLGNTHDILCMKKQLIPDDPHAAGPTKPYLIVNHEYEAARAHAASLIHVN